MESIMWGSSQRGGIPEAILDAAKKDITGLFQMGSGCSAFTTRTYTGAHTMVNPTSISTKVIHGMIFPPLCSAVYGAKFHLKAGSRLVSRKQLHEFTFLKRDLFLFIRSSQRSPTNISLCSINYNQAPAHFCISKRSGDTLRPITTELRVGSAFHRARGSVVKGQVPKIARLLLERKKEIRCRRGNQ